MIRVQACRLGRQSFDQPLLGVSHRPRVLSFRAIRRAGVDLSNHAVGKLKALIIIEQEVKEHPQECGVATHLANDNVQRLDSPGDVEDLAPLLERIIEASTSFNGKVLNTPGLVRSESLSNVEPVERGDIEPDEVVNGDLLLEQSLHDIVRD